MQDWEILVRWVLPMSVGFVHLRCLIGLLFSVQKKGATMAFAIEFGCPSQV